MSNQKEKKLAGKVALITGASRGIGASIANRLASDGASFAITYSKGADAAAAVVKEIEKMVAKRLQFKQMLPMQMLSRMVLKKRLVNSVIMMCS